MASQRAQRVAETIHKEISSLLIKGLKDPRIGFVTITSVDVTSDLRQAKIYYTLMGSQDDRDQTQIRTGQLFILRPATAWKSAAPAPCPGNPLHL